MPPLWLKASPSLADPFLGVSAAYNRYNTTDGKTFLYHLELAYECKEHGAERFVAVQLRQSPEAPSEADLEKQVTFLLRKTCPVPPSGGCPHTQSPFEACLIVRFEFLRERSAVAGLLYASVDEDRHFIK